MNREIIEGQFTKLVEITEKDAPDICRLRNNPDTNRFLSSTEIIRTEEQIDWISKNKALNDNVYFKIIEASTDIIVGTISIYNKHNSEAEFGRYICEKTIQAIEAEFLILKYGFFIMKLDRIYCRTVIENRQVWRQHYKFGFTDVGSDFLSDANVVFKVQEIKKSGFEQFDYNPIFSLLQKINLKFTKI